MKAKTIPVAILIVSVLCSLSLAEWSEPVPVTEVNTEYEEMPPFLSFDGLSLYFSRGHTDTFYYARIFEARRQEPYGPFTSVNEVLSSSYQALFAPWVSPDNLRMYYFAQTVSPILWQIKVSERASVNDPWPQGTGISELNQLGRVHAPTLTADELIIFFDSPDIPGEGGYDIWMATRPDRNLPFDEVTNLTELNTTDNDGGPYVTPDGLTLLFHSNRNGSYQLFRATRQSLTETFGNIEHLSVFDTPDGLSCHPSMSSDGSALYFMRQLSDDRCTRDIYVSYTPYMLAVMSIENAIAEKLDALDKINAALEKEWAAYDALQELLESGDYGDLKKGDIITAMQKVHSSIQQEELSIKALDRSIEKLEDALAALGWEPPPEPEPNLVAYWMFDEGQGDIAYDSAGTNDGTIYGAAWTTGIINSALSFDGVNDYVDVGNDSSLMTTGDLTIYAWIKAQESRACIYSHSWNGWGLGFGIGNNNYDGRLGFYTWTHGHWIEAGGSLADDTWHQVAVTLEGTMVRLYTDGIEIGSDTGTPAANLNGIGLIGLYNYDWFFGGIIDDVMIFDIALSAEEIQQLYQNSSAGLLSQAVDHSNKAAKKGGLY